MAKAINTVIPQHYKSQEYVQDSLNSSDSDSNSVSEELSPPPPGKGQKQKASGVPNGQSDSISESEALSSSETSSSETSSSGASISNRKRQSPDFTTKSEPRTKKSKMSSRSSNSKRRNVEPPAGYEPVRIDATDFVSNIGNMFSNLEGKQIWHITAPASVPITSIETLDIQAALRGEPILQSRGTSYNMFAAAPRGETLLVSDGAEGVYSKIGVDISRNFYLREVPQTLTQRKGLKSPTSDLEGGPNEDHESGYKRDFFAVETGKKKQHRQQPSGLLMRYQPYGSATSASRPYKLANPETADDKENAEISTESSFEPLSEDKKLSTRLARTSKRSKQSTESSPWNEGENSAPGSDTMEIDTTRSSGVSKTLSSKVKKSDEGSESERKKRKKARKEEA